VDLCAKWLYAASVIGVQARRLTEGMQPPELGKAVFWGAVAESFGQQPK